MYVEMYVLVRSQAVERREIIRSCGATSRGVMALARAARQGAPLCGSVPHSSSRGGSSPSMAPSSTGSSSPTPTQMLCSTAHAVTTCTRKRFKETNRNVDVNEGVLIRLIHKSFFTITMYNKKVKQTNMDNYEITYTFGTNSLCTSVPEPDHTSKGYEPGLSASKKMHLKWVFIIPKARSTIERARE